MKKGTRTCLACKEKLNKYDEDYLKLNLVDDTLLINELNSNGKSIYVHKNSECINKFIKMKVLNKKYRKNISDDIYNKLKNYRGNDDK